MLATIKSKTISLKIISSKIFRLLDKTWQVLTTSPATLPMKIKRKLVNVTLMRFDFGFLYRGYVRISGQFYPAAHLLAAPSQRSRKPEPAEIMIIIPVYRNIAVTKRCIDSVLRSNLPPRSRILILNDCSPDHEMPALLDSYVIDARVQVIHNQENLGFVRNVNHGMTLAGGADVVLVNSDTVVAGDWLWSLYAHSLTNEKISSVTATSNNATICSFPIMEGASSWPMALTTEQAQRVLSAHNQGRSVEIPTAVGFCMYITRRSLKALGLFDADAFGKGYGEENDFCLRGRKSGWLHLQALDAAVFHEGEVSFGQSSHPGKARAADIILKRYPDYNHIVGEFAQVDPGRAMRLGALLAMLVESGKSTELICTHIHGGGVEKAVRDFVIARKDKTNFLMLQRSVQKGFYRISSAIDDVKFELEFSPRYSPDVFQGILKVAKVSRLHIHHVMDFDRWMFDVIDHSDIQFDFYIHDYWTICPQITLTTVKGRYCGEPNASRCNICIASRGERTHTPLAEGLPTEINLWRKQYKRLIEQADSIITPSQDTAERIKRYYPASKVSARYHEPQEPLRNSPIKLRPFAHGQKLKVAILGSIGVHKGFYLVSEVQGAIAHTGAPIELKVFGATDPLLKMEHPVPTTGAYREENLLDMLTESGIQIIWFPEGAPETYSYTLSHTMRWGYPVIAPKIGAFPERLVDRPWTELTDLGEGGKRICDLMIKLREKMLKEAGPAK
jgi:GT2 family glycosyltransferase